VPRTVCTKHLGAQQQLDRCQDPLIPLVLLKHLAEAQDGALVRLPVIPAAQAALLHGLKKRSRPWINSRAVGLDSLSKSRTHARPTPAPFLPATDSIAPGRQAGFPANDPCLPAPPATEPLLARFAPGR